MEYLPHYDVVQYAGMTFHMNTIYMTWLTMAIIIVFMIAATRNLSMVPGGLQNVLEMIATPIMEQVEQSIGPRAKKILPIILTLFMFILLSNEIGLLPGKPFYKYFNSPTNDFNTTLGLALFVAILVHVVAVMEKGVVNHVKHFFKPFFPFVFIHLIEEVSRPLTLAIRLFGNIMAGKVLLLILQKMVPWGVPLVWIIFKVVIYLIQAVIFTILTISYISNSYPKEGEEH